MQDDLPDTDDEADEDGDEERGPPAVATVVWAGRLLIVIAVCVGVGAAFTGNVAGVIPAVLLVMMGVLTSRFGGAASKSGIVLTVDGFRFVRGWRAIAEFSFHDVDEVVAEPSGSLGAIALSFRAAGRRPFYVYSGDDGFAELAARLPKAFRGVTHDWVDDVRARLLDGEDSIVLFRRFVPVGGQP